MFLGCKTHISAFLRGVVSVGKFMTNNNFIYTNNL